MDRATEVLWCLLEYVRSFPREKSEESFPDINLITQNTLTRHIFLFTSNLGTPFADGANIVIGSFSNITYVDAILTRAVEVFKILADEESKKKSPIMYPLKKMIYSKALSDKSWEDVSQLIEQLKKSYRTLLLELSLERFDRIDRMLKFDELLVHHPVHAEILRQLFAKDQVLNKDFQTLMHPWN